MDNISKILDAIFEDGKAEAEKIQASGDKKAEEILNLYKEEAAAEQDVIMKKALQETKEIARRSISQAGIESRSIKLNAKRQALKKAFDLALEKLVQLSEKEKQELYKALIGACSGTHHVTLILNKKDKKAFGKKLVQAAEKAYHINLSLSHIEGDFPGGLMLLEGGAEINCTFEVLVEEARKENESKIAEMLFA